MKKKLQVFVSSTYTDLIEERQAAVEAILDAGHIPAGMELFKAGNDSQLKTIYKWIDESDVYMLILGGRYGSVEEQSGLSYTELEYKYALSKKIPIFSVVLSELFLTNKINSLGLSNVIEQKEPNKHQLFKALVMSKMIREVDDSKDIKIAIHSTLNEFITKGNLIGWVRSDTNKDFAILLAENDSLKTKIQKLQVELDNIDKKFNINEPYNALINILKSADFNYYDHTEINALYFFLLNYNIFILEYWYSTDDLAYPIFIFLEKLELIKRVKGTGPHYLSSKADSIRFKLTQYGIEFYKHIQKEHSYILEYCNQASTNYYGNKVFR